MVITKDQGLSHIICLVSFLDQPIYDLIISFIESTIYLRPSTRLFPRFTV